MMKTILSAIFKFVFVFSCVAACSTGALAQTAGGRVQLESLDRLAPKAVENVNVQVDESLIGIARSLLQGDDKDEKNVKEVLVGLKGVYVRILEFKSAGEYAESDIAPIREQLRAPGWTRVVGIETRKKGIENAEVYLSRTRAGVVDGLALLAAGPNELVFVNIVGPVDLEKLMKLEGNLGIPKLHIGDIKIKAGKRSVTITPKRP
jgi:hypothetical protein